MAQRRPTCVLLVYNHIHSFLTIIIYHHSLSCHSQVYERDSGGSGVSARSVGLFTGLVHLQEFIQPWASRGAKERFAWKTVKYYWSSLINITGLV